MRRLVGVHDKGDGFYGKGRTRQTEEGGIGRSESSSHPRRSYGRVRGASLVRGRGTRHTGPDEMFGDCRRP